MTCFSLPSPLQEAKRREKEEKAVSCCPRVLMSAGPSLQNWLEAGEEAWVDGLSLTSTLRILIHVLQEAKRKEREEAVRIARLSVCIPEDSTHCIWIPALTCIIAAAVYRGARERERGPERAVAMG